MCLTVEVCITALVNHNVSKCTKVKGLGSVEFDFQIACDECLMSRNWAHMRRL